MNPQLEQRLRKLEQKILKLVKKGKKTAEAAARLVGVHPATVSRLWHKTLAE